MSDMTYLKTVAIVGAGFSGLATTIHLLGMMRAPVQILLIGDEPSFGRGLAYATRSEHHLLNVPAGRMSMDPDVDDGFTRYLAGRGLPYGSMDFVPRIFYGDYLEWCLQQACKRAVAHIVVQLVKGRVVSIQHPPENGSASIRTLKLADGRCFEADQVVMATGHFSAKRPFSSESCDWASLPLVESPWGPSATSGLSPNDPVLLIGTGLTAVDVVLQLIHQGHKGQIWMLSRRGQLPQPHRHHEVQPSVNWVEEDFCLGEGNLLSMLRKVRDRIRAVQATSNGDWRDVLGNLRAHTPRLWRQLSPRSRKQFVRHLSVFWESHRHRISPNAAKRLHHSVEVQSTVACAGKVLKAEVCADGMVEVKMHLRRQTAPIHQKFARVINCTGPNSDWDASDDPLALQLKASGDVACDALRLGLEMAEGYEVLTTSGEANSGLYYVGPHLRAQYWEATAVPELRLHARAVARRINAALSADS